jgi:hypothetical protein
MSESVKTINKVAVQDLDTDVTFLQKFVEGLGDPTLPQIFEELGQTIDLLQNDNPDEFYDIGMRMRRYANVDPLTGPVLLEKLMAGETERERAASTPVRTGLAARFR